MAPIAPLRPQNTHRTSSGTSQSSSFRSLFTQTNSKLPEQPTPKIEDNRILPVKDFPPQAERRRSSQPDLDINTEEVPVSQNSLAAATTTPIPSRSTSLNHQRSHSLRRKPVPPLLLNLDAEEREQSLPADHPFAATHLRTHSKHNSASSSLRSGSNGRITPVLDVSNRLEGKTPPPPPGKATFTAPLSPTALSDKSNGGTPPPSRSKASIPLFSGDETDVKVVKKKNVRPDTAGTFGGRRSVDKTRPTSAMESNRGQLRRLDKEDALNARMISLSLDRPLPPTPSGSQDMTTQASYSSSGAKPPKMRGSVDTNATSSRSIDLLGMLRSGPSRQSRSSSMSGSVSMSKNGGSSGSKFKSNVFRWDSTEKVMKSTSGEGKKRTSLEEEEFSVDRIPSKKNLWEAGTCFLKDENGNLKCFGDFFPRYPNDSNTFHDDYQNKGKSKQTESPLASPAMEKSATYSGAGSIKSQEASGSKILKTVVFFIRHFWCGQCQDYTFASLSLLDPVALEKAGIRVIIISNGSWKIIKAYKRLFNCPFPIYVDGPRRLYQLLGMTKMTNDFGPMFKGRAAYHQRAVPGQLIHGLGNAFFRMPLASPGTLTQLGGEFILSPGWNCEFAHRMTNTSDHMEAPDVLRAAGCAYPTKSDIIQLELADSQKAELEKLEKEMKEWQENRAAELERIRQKKASRRGIAYIPPLDLSEPNGDASGTFEQDMNQALEARAHTPVELFSKLSGEEKPSEIDARLEEVLQEHEIREKEKLAAGELMLARGKGDLEVQLVQGQA
ncbi:uncharacterized protein I206_100966 [Kwoniella pini CBS 10737]|uniref:Thioredoxin domain-containing protein n=1 Tax=Kwoniella pini CBS 10737 TaxID=1296096 RepID=A0A1B9IBT9_9TREE|nr:uncharacterized protein I206_00360 [Kwoniella pini CBS 10737]OCF53059.1 hypothetical protein I206_00360 [Kwoniella pini CBS 10737]